MLSIISRLLLAHTLFLGCVGELQESKRVTEYHARGYQWPPKPEDYIPNTPGWRQLMERRFKQIQQIEDSGDKYNGFMSTVYSSLIVQNFTENGWALTRAPQNVIDILRKHLHHGLVNNPPSEGVVDAIGGSERKNGDPLMIVDNQLNSWVLEELKPIHEAWANTTLIGNNAYGLRVYRNESNLNMHVDKSDTHVISSILHVDHDPMSEPWPIVIEDFQGRLHEVVLESGDVLLYESSKCFHGRPKRFNGSWYTSLFIHYYPDYWTQNKLETHYRIPPTWHILPEEKMDNRDKLIVVGTSFKEPNCKNEWCALEDSVKWAVPSISDTIISSDGLPKNLFGTDEL